MRNYELFDSSGISGVSWIGSPAFPRIFALHGFTGNYLDYQIVVDHDSTHYNWISLPCPGHNGYECGETRLSYNRDYLDRINHFIKKDRSSVQKILMGYSMGGRYALRYALHFPKSINALILVSCNAGLESKAAREDRIIKDQKWINKLRHNSIESFMQEWLSQDLLKSQRNINTSYFHDILTYKKMLNAEKLSNSLRYFGSGAIKSVEDKLSELKIPTLLLAGENDMIYRKKMECMHSILPKSELIVLPRSGHSCHLENPYAANEAINRFLSKVL